VPAAAPPPAPRIEPLVPQAAPRVEIDYRSPEAPGLGQLEAHAGSVSLAVTAEAGSTITVVDDFRNPLASAIGTGDWQTVTFALGDGRRIIHVQAADRAGNRSSDSTTEVTVDASAPGVPEMVVSPPSEQRHLTKIEISGEPGTSYRIEALSGSGEVIADSQREGTVEGDGHSTEMLVLRNGDYQIVSTLTDGQGNRSPNATAQAHVDVPPPSMSISRSSRPNERNARFTIAGPAAGHGTLTLGSDGSDSMSVPFVLGDEGVVDVDIELLDGLWSVAASTTDFQDRPVEATLTDQVVDTVNPQLEVVLDEEARQRGIARATFVVEDGSTVEVSGLPVDPQIFNIPGPAQFEASVGTGSYRLEFEATDGAGNREIRSFDFVVPRHPVTGAMGGLFLLLALAGGGWFVHRALKRRRSQAHPVSPNPPHPQGSWARVVSPTGPERLDWVPTTQPPSPDGRPGLWHVVVDTHGAFLRWEWHSAGVGQPAQR
jgi:hypothetical protein